MSFKFTKEDELADLHPNIAKFSSTFISNRVLEYEIFKHSVDAGDMSSIRLHCHKIVGIAASYNCHKLEEIALYVQKCSREDDIESIKSVLSIYDQYMKELASQA
jgi:hypothetical protein